MAQERVDDGANEVWWVALPPGTGSPVTVYVNGRELREGDGIAVHGDRVWFDTPLRARPALGFWRQVMLALGIGVYGDLKGDSIDLTVTRNGRPETRSDWRPPATGRPPLEERPAAN